MKKNNLWSPQDISVHLNGNGESLIDHSLVERKAFNKQEQSPGSRVILGGVQSAVGEHRAGRPKNIGGPGKSSRESSSN